MNLSDVMTKLLVTVRSDAYLQVRTVHDCRVHAFI